MPEFLSDNTTTTTTTITDDPPEADVLVRLGPQMHFVFSEPQKSLINHIFMHINQLPLGHPIGLMIPGMTNISATIIATALLVAFDTGFPVYCYLDSRIEDNSLILSYMTTALSIRIRSRSVNNHFLVLKDKNNANAYLAIKSIDTVGDHVGLGYNSDRVYIVDRSVVREEHRPYLVTLASERGYVFTAA